MLQQLAIVTCCQLGLHPGSTRVLVAGLHEPQRLLARIAPVAQKVRPGHSWRSSTVVVLCNSSISSFLVFLCTA